MLRKALKFGDTSVVLGEATAGAIEDLLDATTAEGVTERQIGAAVRAFLAHSLSRGGTSMSAEDIRNRFTLSEINAMFRAAQHLSGMREIPEGELVGP